MNSNKSDVKVRRTNNNKQLKLFKKRGDKFITNPLVMKSLKNNPYSIQLPKEYIWNQTRERVMEAGEFTISSIVDGKVVRKLKNDYKDEYILHDDALLPNVQEGQQEATASAFNNYVQSLGTGTGKLKGYDSLNVLQRFRPKIQKMIRNYRSVRFHVSTLPIFKKLDGTVVNDLWVSTKLTSITSMKEYTAEVKKIINELKEKYGNLETKGSGLQFVKANKVYLNVTAYEPLRGSSYIPTPEEISHHKKGLINLENTDSKCFKYAVLCALNHKQIASRKQRLSLNTYKDFTNADFSMFDEADYPISASSRKLDTFETKNNIVLNIYHYEQKTKKGVAKKGKVVPLRYTRMKNDLSDKSRRFVNLLLISNSTGKRHHYVTITEMSALLSSEIGNYSGNKIFICPYCLAKKNYKDQYDNHISKCSTHKPMCVNMPEKGSVLKFKKHIAKIKAPLMMVADFETFPQDVNPEESRRGEGTSIINRHKPNSYCLKVMVKPEYLKMLHEKREIALKKGYVDVYRKEDKRVRLTVDDLDGCIKRATDTVFKYVDREGKDDTIEKFLSKVIEIENWFLDEMQQFLCSTKNMCMTTEQKNEYKKATHCHICEGKFTNEIVYLKKETRAKIYEENKGLSKLDIEKKIREIARKIEQKQMKVRDHDHQTGCYRGAAHSSCNVNFNEKYTKIPVFFHNLTGFDQHLIVQHADTMWKMKGQKMHCKPKVIPRNTEKYIQIQYGKIIFLDSANFLSSSLGTLAHNLEDKKKVFTKSYFKKQGYSDEQINLLLQKGVYPYDYVKSSEKFKDKELPDKKYFYNYLNESECSDTDYKHAQKVWKELGCKTFLDYHELYLLCDVLLLADIMQEFISLSYKTYGLDPSYFVTLPGYAWECMLKKTGIELELLIDEDMLLMYESGIRGGLSYINHRLATAKLHNQKRIYINNNGEHLVKITATQSFLSLDNWYKHEGNMIVTRTGNLILRVEDVLESSPSTLRTSVLYEIEHYEKGYNYCSFVDKYITNY